MDCKIQRPKAVAWITAGVPSAKTLEKATSRTTAVTRDGFTFQMRCPGKNRYVTLGTVLTFPWTQVVPNDVASDADVRRLFDSIAAAVAGAVPEHSLQLTLEVQ